MVHSTDTVTTSTTAINVRLAAQGFIPCRARAMILRDENN